MSDGGDRPTVAFVCVQNAGRSQMATALAEREERGLDVEVLTGGPAPERTSTRRSRTRRSRSVSTSGTTLPAR